MARSVSALGQPRDDDRDIVGAVAPLRAPHELAVAARWKRRDPLTKRATTCDEATPPYGESLLHMASHHGHVALVKQLLAAGAVKGAGSDALGRFFEATRECGLGPDSVLDAVPSIEGWGADATDLLDVEAKPKHIAMLQVTADTSKLLNHPLPSPLPTTPWTHPAPTIPCRSWPIRGSSSRSR